MEEIYSKQTSHVIYNILLPYFSFSFWSFLLQVPPYGKGALYIRPLLFGSGSVMGIAPAPECSFLIYTNPICNVYKVGDHRFQLWTKPVYRCLYNILSKFNILIDFYFISLVTIYMFVIYVDLFLWTGTNFTTELVDWR